MRATNCCCGVPLHTAVVFYGSFDVIIGIIYVIAFVAGVTKLSFAPDFGIYEISWMISSVSNGFLAIMGGCVGIHGVQKKDAKSVLLYSYIKVLQNICMLVSCFMILTNMDSIADKLADETIQELIEEAARKHMDPPKIDRDQVYNYIVQSLQLSCYLTMLLWSTLGLYGYYIIHSLGKWYQAGLDPAARRLQISVPSESSRIQYVSPLLQGQTPMIPVAIQ